MSRTRPGRAALAAVLAAVALCYAAAPATAEAVTVKDPADATGSLTDIRAVRVAHGPQRLLVRVFFTDLQRDSDGGPSGLSVFLDTDPARKGPEFRLSTGLQEGTDYALVRMSGWKVTGQRLTCAHSVRLDFAAHRVTARVARTCLGRPATVRVGVRMRDDYDASHPMTDWLGSARSFTRAVSAG